MYLWNEVKFKKGSYKLYIMILIIILLVVGIYSMFHIIRTGDERQVKKVTDDYIEIIENKEYKELLDVLEKQSYTSLDYSFKEVVEKYNNIFNGINIKNIHASNVKVDKLSNKEQELSYQLSFTTPLGKIKNISYHTKVIKTNGDYFVKWNPSLIFPGMSEKDKVAFHTWEAERGEIKDHLGNGLAVNGDFKQAGVIPKELNSGNERKKVQLEISRHFNISIEDINEKLNQSWVRDDLFVPLKVVETNQAKEIPGISYRDTKLRYYPLKEAAANLIGYTGKVTKEDLERNSNLIEGELIGKTGLERTLDKRLRGKSGGEIMIVDEFGEEKKSIQKVKQTDGEDIELTIDSYIQTEAFKHLQGNSGSTVVMNPKEGGLYALVSSPSFDPNKMVQGISQKEYDEYLKDDNKPLISKFSTRYAPGSTFKTITASIGLDANVTSPTKQREIHGLSWQKDKSWGGYSVTRVSDVKDMNMKKALIYSDNIYFAQETLEMGEQTFRKGLDQFIFDEDLDLPLAMKPAQISNQSEFNSEILLADTGYGQGELLISPIQQITMYSIFQNDGDIIYPKLLKDEKDRKTKTAIKSSTANDMKKYLEEVVSDSNGTAHSLYNPKYQLAAKTGTAELKMEQGEKGRENSFLLALDSGGNKFILLSLIEDYTEGSSATKLNQTFIESLYEYIE